MNNAKSRLAVQRKWSMYDWANSVYSLIITSTFLPEYYVSVTQTESNKPVIFLGVEFVNTSLYSYALACSFLIIAIISPILAVLVDSHYDRKKNLVFFLVLGSVACIGLFFFTKDTLTIGIIMIMLSCIGYWCSLVFYNSYLPEIASLQEMDIVSAMGYKYGYLGSFILQVICLVLVYNYEHFGIATASLAVRYSFILVGVWWLGFGIYAIKSLPRKPQMISKQESAKDIVKRAYNSIFKVAREALKIILLRKFLTAYLFFNMGIQVVMLVATIYGAKELQIPTTYLIITIIIIQLLAIVGADLSSLLSKKIGNFLALFMLCCMWISVCVIAYLLPKENVVLFGFLGAYVGLLMGGSQSLNRSTYAKIIPKTIFNTTYFSFYDVVEKLSIVIGMFFFAYVEEFTGSMRNSVIVITVFFIIGSILLLITYRRSKKHNLLVA